MSGRAGSRFTAGAGQWLIVVVLLAGVFARPALARHDCVELDEWQYRWGDSPRDAAGTPLWLSEDYDEANPDWTGLRFPERAAGRGDEKIMWMRTALPEVEWPNPALYLPTVCVSFDVYVGDTLIYQYGEFKERTEGKYTAVTTHVIPLPPGFRGETLSLRMYSNIHLIGPNTAGNPVLVGDADTINRAIFLLSAESLFISSVLLFIGFAGVLMALMQFRQRRLLLLWFGLFALSMGVFYSLFAPAALHLIESPVLKLYARGVAFSALPLAIILFLRQFLEFKRLLWALFAVHCVVTILVFAADFAGVVTLPVGLDLSNYVFIVTAAVMAGAGFVSARRGSASAKIFVWGFAILSLSGINDMLMGLGVIPHWHWISQWGALLFILVLGFLVERDSTESHRQLKRYSHELEDMVRERTRDLDEKNRQLQQTLADLRDAQQQLVLREKMASLGNLVAGVAHEVNTPIGAVGSAADVSARCIEALEAFVKKPDGNEESAKQALELLHENNDVIAMASTRISTLVKSLKNFARLDEAERQRADIHEGIDSTLTLLHHRVKHGIEIVKSYGDIPRILIYPNRLNQVFMNLLTNAVDAVEASGGGGTITIDTHMDDGNVCIDVTDTGVGIPPENLEHIFDPGFTTKGVGVGTGLGLSISYKIVEQHGGKLSVESTPGKGAKFTVTLPRINAAMNSGENDEPRNQ